MLNLMRRFILRICLAGLTFTTLAAQGLAQIEVHPPPPRQWQFYLTAATPETSKFSSQAFGAELSYEHLFSVELHGGPAYRHPDSKTFAPLLWGSTLGARLQIAADVRGGSYVGGYLRADRTRAGFDYQGFIPNQQLGISEAGPVERACFEQDFFEIGALYRFTALTSPWLFQVEMGLAAGTRGMYTPSDIYPGYNDLFILFGNQLNPYNQANRLTMPRGRLMVGYRLGGYARQRA